MDYRNCTNLIYRCDQSHSVGPLRINCLNTWQYNPLLKNHDANYSLQITFSYWRRRYLTTTNLFLLMWNHCSPDSTSIGSTEYGDRNPIYHWTTVTDRRHHGLTENGRKIILQPDLTQSHNYKDYEEMSTTSVWHTEQLTWRRQKPWTCFSQEQLQCWLY